MNRLEKISSFLDALFVRHHGAKITDSSERVIKSMKPAEKLLFGFLVIIATISAFLLLSRVHKMFLVETPAYGGSFVEGLVGNPRFINPILAISDTDKDIGTLVYSGLLKVGKDGSYQNDLAESLSVSEDGLVYTVRIKEGAIFHDGKPVTTNDIVFTVEKILDPIIKSPRRANWEGVSLEKIDTKEIHFILKKPFAPFMDALTLGILPKHIWESASSEEFPFSEWNVSPIGSGPYKVSNTKRNSAGIPSSISLSAFDKYVGGKPYIKSITFKFFQNETELLKAYESQEIDSIARISKESAQILLPDKKFISASLPRVFGAFFNQNVAPVFLNKEVREALDLSAPKDEIVNKVLLQFGSVSIGPTPAQQRKATEAVRDIEAAKEILAKAGWKLDEADGVLKKKTKSETTPLAFTISTSDTPELKETAELLKTAWQELGARVDIKVFESSDLNQNIIRPRKYDVLLFGEVIGSESDLYSFWHSSQRNDPGLNIPLYANITADKLLEEMRLETDQQKLKEKLALFTKEITEDVPAIFLFVPDMIYVPAENIKNVYLPEVSSPSQRFNFAHEWFIETDKVWRLFANNNS